MKSSLTLKIQCTLVTLEAVRCSEVENAVLEAPDTTDGVVGADATDAVGGWEAGDTGAVGVAGLALTAWQQAACCRSSPSRTGRGDEVSKEEDWDLEGKWGRKSWGHLADPRCSCNSLWLGHWRW